MLTQSASGAQTYECCRRDWAATILQARDRGPESGAAMSATTAITIFLCGDVMTGRGIDQILPHHVDPVLYEPVVKDARTYVRIAEERNGPLAAPVAYEYVWGDALGVLKQVGPSLRLINLETSVTTSNDHQEGKEIHYRMHPGNTRCLQVAGIDCCILANNHVLDWGRAGLLETLRTIEGAGMKAAGAGRNAEEAARPVVLDTGKGARVLVLAFGTQTSGVSPGWAATAEKPGVSFLGEFSEDAVRRVAARVKGVARDNDVVIVSIHWGGNWGYTIPAEQTDFAHRLIDEAGVDVVHGHSSHHVKGLEVYKNRLILYGSGDFLNDYEGIGGHEAYRPDLRLMYFPTIDATTGTLEGLRLAPMQIRQFRLSRASRPDAAWLGDVLNRESRGPGIRVILQDDGMLAVQWDH
jgi:poly-gamma-glutamate capsule biosynthesis protein CapA/YwtB (metallophosphatase superfamily)